MKTYTYFSKGSESVRLHSGEQGMIVVPFKKQPKEQSPGVIYWNNEYFSTETFVHWATKKCPLGQPGDIINVKEAHWQVVQAVQNYPIEDEYSMVPCRHIPVHYDSDGPPRVKGPNDWGKEPGTLHNGKGGFLPYEKYMFWNKRSAALMSLEAVRTKLRVIKVTAKMVQEITEVEAELYDIDREDLYDAVGKLPYVAHGTGYIWKQLLAEKLIQSLGSEAWESNSWVWCIEVGGRV